MFCAVRDALLPSVTPDDTRLSVPPRLGSIVPWLFSAMPPVPPSVTADPPSTGNTPIDVPLLTFMSVAVLLT
jgi:hypothetical protein